MKEKAKEYLDLCFKAYSPSTVKATRTFLKQYYGFLSSKGMEEGVDSLIAWANELEKKGLKPRSIKQAVSTVLSYMKTMGFNIDQRKLLILRRMVPHDEPNVAVMSEDEVRDLIFMTDNVTYRLIFILMYIYARRLGEVLALKWEDVDFNMKTISFPILKKKAKTKATFPMDNATANMLRSYRQITRRTSGRVFPLTERAVQLAFKNSLKKAHITLNGRRLTPHTLRASRITHLLKNGMPLDVVSKHVARHTNIETTMMHYRAITSEEVDRIPLYEDFIGVR